LILPGGLQGLTYLTPSIVSLLSSTSFIKGGLSC
jgi:hypothetical protein